MKCRRHAHLGARWAHLGARWAHLGARWAHLDARYAHLGARWALGGIGKTLESFGKALGNFGKALGGFGKLREQTLSLLSPSLPLYIYIHKSYKLPINRAAAPYYKGACGLFRGALKSMGENSHPH